MMAFDTTTILSASTIALLAILYYRYKNIYSYWERKNIKGPKPYYAVGHLIHLLRDSEFTKKCVERYGRVYGIYEAHEPVLMIADAELAKQICIKDFDSLPDHKLYKFLNQYDRMFLFNLRYNLWHRVRALMTPSFTSGKMRKMVKLMDKCGNDLIATFEDQIDVSTSGKEATVDLKETYSVFTLDAISTCCYAIKLERVKSATNLKMMAARNELVSQAMEFFNFSHWRLLLMYLVNEKILELLKFEALPSKRIYPLINRIKKLIESRRKSGRKFEDLLQLLIDSKLDDQAELDESDSKENHHAALTDESIKTDQAKIVAEAKLSLDETESTNITQMKNNACLNDEEILANACILVSVGVETTATLLTCCTHALAFHKKIQEQLREEVKKIATFDAENNSTFDYDTISSCQYLDAVISEALRLSSPVTMTDRVACQDYYIEQCDVTLPKGSRVYLDWATIMIDPEYWPEPNKFDPERFMPQNKGKIVPGSYCPFGLGSRHCLGMRFSLIESKLALAKMILKFEFNPAPGTSFPLETRPNFGLRLLDKPLVNLKRLEN